MFRQPLFQILNIWSSQAPQALNIIQVVAKSTFPKLVGSFPSPHYQSLWADPDMCLPHSLSPMRPALGQALLWERVRVVGISVLLGTLEKPQENETSLLTQALRGGLASLRQACEGRFALVVAGPVPGSGHLPAGRGTDTSNCQTTSCLEWPVSLQIPPAWELGVQQAFLLLQKHLFSWSTIPITNLNGPPPFFGERKLP